MILERAIRDFMLKCDVCGCCYSNAAGPYHLNKDKMLEDAVQEGWNIDRYSMKCPDCK